MMKLFSRGICVLMGAALLGLLGPVPAKASADYQAEVEEWRQKREEQLKAEDGWLAVAGLYWLKEGENRFGTDTDDDFVLPAGTAPGLVGVFDFHNGSTVVRVESGASVTSEGRQVTEMVLKPDTSGEPDYLVIGNLTMYVIERGGKYGIRLKDKNSKTRREFTGLKWYPVDESYRVTGTFVEYTPPKKIPIANVLGQIQDATSPGYVTFRLGDKELQLDAIYETPDADLLYFIFRDRTSGKTTYPGGRQLYAQLPKEGKVVLDFNQAYNFPCAFSNFTTCQIPPRQNHLSVAVEAGEKAYKPPK